jgi:hypothetical protein
MAFTFSGEGGSRKSGFNSHKLHYPKKLAEFKLRFLGSNDARNDQRPIPPGSFSRVSLGSQARLAPRYPLLLSDTHNNLPHKRRWDDDCQKDRSRRKDQIISAVR